MTTNPLCHIETDDDGNVTKHVCEDENCTIRMGGEDMMPLRDPYRGPMADEDCGPGSDGYDDEEG